MQKGEGSRRLSKYLEPSYGFRKGSERLSNCPSSDLGLDENEDKFVRKRNVFYELLRRLAKKNQTICLAANEVVTFYGTKSVSLCKVIL